MCLMTSRIEYHCTTVEKLVEEQKSFDAVLAVEVIQHVANPSEFCKSLSSLTVPDGAIMISSTEEYPIPIIIEKYLLNRLPNGTPQRLSALEPDNLVQFMKSASISFQGMAAFILHYWRANFVAFGTKPPCKD
ncbi:hypothetical protein M0R45_032442 [Rubus argutus]|uniref:Methyltransferase type 11 domain-containing protein n=1 Tax=Rubus argutus TaxID=59490 RepID=A0AAW1WHP8_RUBAR